MKKVLFVHNNFPAQFKHLAPRLVETGGYEVASLSYSKSNISGIKNYNYNITRNSTAGIHPWVSDFETKMIRAEACLDAAIAMKKSGYNPDCIVAHPGWGEPLFLKDVWPKAKLGLYCEFYYHHQGFDVGFEEGYQSADPKAKSLFRAKNINNDLLLAQADLGISPTHWQASSFPESFRERITVVHDGIDTNVVTPNPNIRLQLSNGLTLTKSDEVVTFVNRNLEPYRGFHVFMRALPKILSENKNVKILIVGGDGLSYGAPPIGEKSWKDAMIREVWPQLADDQKARVFFLGNLPYEHYLSVLRVSTVHVYLTFPFVLSWSLLEAMSAGCCVIASSTKPVEEVIEDGVNGFLVDFHDVEALIGKIISVLKGRVSVDTITKDARESVVKKYDLNSVSLPLQAKWVNSLINS